MKLNIPGDSAVSMNPNGHVDTNGAPNPGGQEKESSKRDPASGTALASALSPNKPYQLWAQKGAGDKPEDEDTESTGGDATAAKSAAEGYSGKKVSPSSSPGEVSNNLERGAPNPEGYDRMNTTDTAVQNMGMHRFSEGSLAPMSRHVGAEGDDMARPAITKPGIPSPNAVSVGLKPKDKDVVG